MINNQSNKSEKLEPKDSKEKQIRHPQDDENAVLRSEDKTYKEENADFKNVAKKKENSDRRPS